MKQPETAVHTVAAFEKAAMKKLGTRTSRALPEGTQGAADKAAGKDIERLSSVNYEKDFFDGKMAISQMSSFGRGIHHITLTLSRVGIYLTSTC